MGVQEDIIEPEENGVPSKENGGASSPPPPPPPQEEPPKMEEIVTTEVIEAVKNGYKPELKLVSFEAEIGSKVGDNYMSIMYAVDMYLKDPKTDRQEKLKIMLKTIPRNIVRAEMITEMKAFIKETAIYQDILPKLKEFQKERGLPQDMIFESWPACYAAHVDGTTDYLAMKNLREDGYVMGSRKDGLDFNHLAFVLRQMARFHAMSYAKFGGKRHLILETFPVLNGGMFNKNVKTNEMQQQFFAQSFKGMATQLRNGGDETAALRLEKLAGMDFVEVLGGLVQNNVEHAVIIHGDCWVNNMLFKYDEKDSKCRFPTSFKFLDFQLSTATSRCVDIYYFLLTSSKLDALAKNERELLTIYFAEFTQFAMALGVDTRAKGLTFEALLEEASRFRFYGVCLALILAPMLAADSADIPDMDSFTEEDLTNPDEAIETFLKDMTKGPAIKKAKTIVLDHLPKCSGFEQYL